MRLALLPLLLLALWPSRAQAQVRDSTVAMTLISLSYAHQLPGGDLADRFGHNSNIGFSVLFKTRTNWTFGAEAGFLFGNQVNEPGILRNTLNSMGQLVDQAGVMSDVFLFERGYGIYLTAGRLFPVIGPNPNSGLLVRMGGGYLRHKVRVQTQQNVVPQVEDEYLEGYDRLTAGPAALLYLGYQHTGNRRLVNFHAGVEFQAGFTSSLRAFNFDTETYNTDGRFDLLSGIRVGWSLPIYQQSDDRYHYY